MAAAGTTRSLPRPAGVMRSNSTPTISILPNRSLARMVDELKRGPYAMVIGSYTMVNFKLETIPPGLIDHREWTRDNGRNNALRINGLGAPRAFDTAIARGIGFPNVSYGEDYAVGLRISRDYEIGRIYDSLYLCRRWEGNSDSALPLETANRYDSYKDGLRTDEILARQTTLTGCSSPRLRPGLRWLEVFRDCAKARLGSSVSSGATFWFGTSLIASRARPPPVDAASIAQRQCFLCPTNLDPEEQGIPFDSEFTLYCNPFPILERHLTIVHADHRPQRIAGQFGAFLKLAQALPDSFIIYNGPECGASAPDHLHFQSCSRAVFPIDRDILHDGLHPTSLHA